MAGTWQIVLQYESVLISDPYMNNKMVGFVIQRLLGMTYMYVRATYNLPTSLELVVH